MPAYRRRSLATPFPHLTRLELDGWWLWVTVVADGDRPTATEDLIAYAHRQLSAGPDGSVPRHDVERIMVAILDGAPRA